MKRRLLVRILLITLAATVMLQVVLSFVGVGLFCHFFFARYDTFCPTDLKESDLIAPHTQVTFESDGNTLSGLFIGDGTEGLIVIVHGLNSGMDAHFPEAEYFAAHGYTVFTFDGRGSRTSEGSTRSSITAMRDDLNAALDYLSGTAYSSYSVYLYGHSSGGYAVAATADRAEATVAIAAFNDPVDLMCAMADRYSGFLSYLQRPYLALWNRILAGSDANECAADALNLSGARILIISPDRDSIIPPDCMLAAHADAITDPNASYRTYAGDHSDLWLSSDALAYRAETANQSEGIDRLRYNAVDTAFLDDVLAFFEG